MPEPVEHEYKVRGQGRYGGTITHHGTDLNKLVGLIVGSGYRVTKVERRSFTPWEEVEDWRVQVGLMENTAADLIEREFGGEVDPIHVAESRWQDWKPGDKVKVYVNDRTYEGIVQPDGRTLKVEGIIDEL